MTEQEAQRMLDEHRRLPRFVRYGNRYVARADGTVDVWKLSKSGKRAVFSHTVEKDDVIVPKEMRDRLK